MSRFRQTDRYTHTQTQEAVGSRGQITMLRFVIMTSLFVSCCLLSSVLSLRFFSGCCQNNQQVYDERSVLAHILCIFVCVCVRMCSYMKCLSDRVGCVYSSVVEKGCRKPPGWMVSPLYPSFKPCVKTSNSPHLLYHISVVLINTVLYLFPHH